MSFVKGEVKHQIYFNSKSNYGVYAVKIDETDEPEFDFLSKATVTGYFHEVEVGSVYRFDGKVSYTEKYGYSFICDKYERVLPTSREGIIEYLSGDTFKGIGKATAGKIYDALGPDCIEKIINNKAVLDLVPGLKEDKKNQIFTILFNNKDMQNTIVTLYSYGITPKFAMRIYEKYKDMTLEIISKNPYVLVDDIEGIGFLKADEIALKTGVNVKSEMRVEACIRYCLYQDSEQTGNTLLERNILINKTLKYLNFDFENDLELVTRCLEKLKTRVKVEEIDGTVSDELVISAERYISKKLSLMASIPTREFYQEEMDTLLKELEEKLDIQYEDEQKEAIYRAMRNNCSIITGGPGTGKTTIERGIIYLYENLVNNDRFAISLAAPTGKAAKRIEEATGYKAQTIHRLLGYDTLGRFTYNKFNPLEGIELLIIDESSMVDVFLFHHLLEAIPAETKIVIVGDSDQLPSIGPGQILKDLIDSDVFKVTKLKKIHRQKENSKIISLAYDCLNGEITTELDELHDELTFIPSTVNDLNPLLKSLVHHYMNEGYSLHSDIQILIPMYKGLNGIDAVNRYMQLEFNQVSYTNEVNKNTFFIDDKVIQLINQYEDEVMNGDMGVVVDTLVDKEVIVDFNGNVVTYKGQDLNNINLAYSISIHKSQGSEFPVVILPIFPSYRVMLNKKLIYTAITRAKNNLVLIGDFRTFRNAITVEQPERKTRLKKFLQHSCKN